MILRMNKNRIGVNQSINLFITGLLLLPIYIDLMSRLSLLIGFSTKLTTYIYYGSLWVLLLTSIPAIFQKVSSNTIVCLAAFVFFTLSQLVLFPNNRIYIIPQSVMDLLIFSPSTLLGVVPYILVGLIVTDMQGLSELLHRGSRIGIVLGALSYLVAISRGYEIHYDDMSNAYALCTVICIVIACYRKNDIYFLILGAFSLILAGTRGPIVCVIAAVIIKTLVLEASATKKLLKVLLGVLIIIVLQSNLFLAILDWIEEFFNGLGVKELRIVEYFREDMMTDSSGRDTYADLVIKYIKEAPLVGYGVGGDRFIIRRSYVHNILLEMWASYGILGGTAIVVWMGYWIIKGIRSQSKALASVTSALFCGIVVKLFLSSSYLYSKELFLLLGVCMSNCVIKTERNVVNMKDNGYSW